MDGHYVDACMQIGRRLLAHYSDEEADEWLTSPHPELDNQTPLTVMETLEGVSRVNAIIDQLDADAS